MFMETSLEFQQEMNRLRSIEWEGYSKTLGLVGISYLGAVAHSQKMMHSYLLNVSTYCIYLASGNLSGIEVCGVETSKNCRANCLMGSGQNSLSRRSSNEKNRGKIDVARNTKTRLFFANKQVFMRLMMYEIDREIEKAKRVGHEFSIRINATSDLAPTAFRYYDEELGTTKNLFELYPNIQFYDYTKVPTRINLARETKNYDITWSIDGSADNLQVGLNFLKNGGRVAVVFGTDTLPKKWHGYEVVDGDKYDMRYKDGNVVVGLKFKKTANNYVHGKFVMPNTDFIVTETDLNCEW